MIVEVFGGGRLHRIGHITDQHATFTTAGYGLNSCGKQMVQMAQTTKQKKVGTYILSCCLLLVSTQQSAE